MKQDGYIDFLKGIAILLVIFGHCLQYGSGSIFLDGNQYWNNVVMQSIYSFHMPLFIAISGYLSYFSFSRHGIWKSVIRRLHLLLPICASWAVILAIREIIMGNPMTIKRLVYFFLTDFWFLWSVVVCVLIVAMIECVRIKIGGGTCVVLCAIGFLSFFITPDALWMNAHKFMLPFFYGGFLFARMKKKVAEHSCVGILSVALWVIGMIFYSYDCYIYTTGITLLGKSSIIQQLYIDGYRYLIAFLGVVAIIWISKNVYSRSVVTSCTSLFNLQGIIEYMGKNSIVFYILSTYVFVWVMPVVTYSLHLNYLITLAETVIVSILCAVLSFCIKKFGKLSKIIIGK